MGEEVTHKLIIGYDYTENIDPQAINEIIKMGFGHGTNVISDVGNKQAEILDYDLLNAAKLVDVDTFADFRKVNADGSSYTEVTQKINSQMGFEANAKTNKAYFNNAVKTATSSTTQGCDNYDYGIRMMITKVLAANLCPCDDLKRYVKETALHDINGTPNSAGKINYPTEDAALKRLFNIYGTHVITKAIFGTKYEYYYLRESTEKSTFVSEQRDCNLSTHYQNDVEGLKNLGVSKFNNYGEELSECTKNAFGIEVEKRIGGGSMLDLSEWQASCDFNRPQTIALVGYTFSDTTTDNGLIPIWKLVDDPQRAAKMEQVYDAYVKENTPVLKKGKQIVVDVYGKYYGKGDTVLSSFYMYDYKGKMRKFIQLEENIFDHLHGAKKGSYYFYYALGYAGESGLTGLAFIHEKDVDGSSWIARGENAQKGITGCMDDNVLAINLAPLKNGKVNVNDDQLVSGFGLKIKGKISKISKGTDTNFSWHEHDRSKDWYHGLAHDETLCMYTTNTLNEF